MKKTYSRMIRLAAVAVAAAWMTGAFAATVSAATLSAAPTRTCLFTPTGGAPRDLVIAGWSATVNGAPHELVVGEHRCGFHRFRGGWTFPGFDPRILNEVVMTGTFEAPSDGEVAAGLSGDWFYDLALDGKAVFSTGSGGNGTSEYGYWNKTAKFPVTAGRHVLTVSLRNGMGGLMFALGKPEARPVVTKEPVAVADALAAARRIWAGDVYERNNAKRRADMAVIQRAIDMTSGDDFGKAVRGDRSAALFAKAPALAVIDAAVDRILAEVPVTKVAKGTVAVWYYYDMGHVVKTPGGTVFGIDLSGPRDAEIADILDFALVTHNHGDHASDRVLRAMQKKGGFANGKPVVSSFMYSPWNARSPKTYTFGDCTVETGVSDHNPHWTDSMTPYKVTCGRGPEAVTLLHAGDGWDGAQLAHFAPVDVVICHVWPFDGHNAEKTASVLKPDLLVVSHAQEMSHGFGPGRWDWSACEEEAARATAAGTAIYPVWGERFVWRKRSLKPALVAKELPAGAAGVANLVPNGGFELGEVGWHVRTTRPRMDAWTCAPVSAPAEGAWRGRSLRVDVPQGATVRVSSEPLRLEPGVRYFVSARVKAETPGRTSLVLACPVLNDWWSAGTKGADVSGEWRRIEGFITVKEGHHEALLTVDWNRPGAFWIDDVQVCREEACAFAPRGGFEAGFVLDDTYAAPGARKLRFRAVGYDRDETRDIVLRAEHPATGWRQTRTVRMDLKRGVATEQAVDFDLSQCGELRLSSDAPGDIPVHFAVMPQITEPLPLLGEDFSVGVNETGVFPPIGSWDQNYQGIGRSFAEHLALLRACGVQHVRAFNEDFSHFALFNPERGVYDTTRLEPWLRAMADAGLPCYLTLKFNFNRRRDLDGWKHWSAERTKRWYLFRESRPTGRLSPTWPKVKEEILPNVDDVAAICAELAKTCKGKVGWYEIFNEPNLELHDPADCVRYQKAICEAMKKADPDCRLAGICTTQDFGVEGAADFAGGCLRNGIASYLDAVAFHPYSASVDNGICPAASFLRTLRDLVRPYPHVQLWNTECFYLLNRSDTPVWRKKDPMFLRPQNLVRRCLVDLGEGVRVSSSVHVMQLFRPHFDEMTQHTGEHSGYRLTPTDAAVGLAAFSKLMNRATAVRPLEGSLPEGLCGYLYKLADGRPVAVLWAFENRRKFIVTSDAAAYDMYGNRLEGADRLVDERPVYVVGAGDPEAFFKSLAIRYEKPVVENGRRRIDADTVAVEILDFAAKTRRTEFRRPVAGDPARFGKTARSGEKVTVGPLSFAVTLAEEGVVVEAHTVDTNRIVGTWQQPWTGDTIELFFDANPYGGLDVSRDAPETFRLFVLPPTPDPASDPKHRPRQLATNTRKLDVRGISQRIDADGNGFGVHLVIPWRYFGSERPKDIGFDIIADDFDPVTGQRTAAHVWSGDDANYESRFKWGRVVTEKENQ